MIIKDVTYKWYNLSSTTYNIVLNENNKNVALRTNIYQKQNFHGARSSYTLSEWRLFIFSGVIYGATYIERQTGVDYINWLIKPEGLPSETNTGYYELTWKDWNNNKFKCNAKVYKVCEFKHVVNEPIIEFTFELYADVPYYFGYTDQVVTWASTNNLAGVLLPSILEFWLSWVANTMSILNSWNFVAPCKIELVWTLENPVIYNNTNSTAYRLDWITTTDLIIDNRWESLIVTDEWDNVSKYRGSWSASIFLAPWLNEIYIFWDNADPSIVATVTYNHTYINS
jgi:hypothetical protein